MHNLSKMIELFDAIKNENLDKIRQLTTNLEYLNGYLYGATPLIYSIECRNEKVALELSQNQNIDLNCRDNLDESCLKKAIEFKMYKLIEIICKRTKKHILNELLDNQETLLTDCLKNNDMDAAIALINGGVDVNLPNKLNEYPLQLAIRFNKLDVIKSLLNRNDIVLRNLSNKYDPLLDACEKDLTQIALLLIENGAQIDAQDKSQLWTPLMHAITNNNEIIIHKLLEKGCNLDTVDEDGNTCVHMAVLNENEYILKLLLNHNAPKNLANNENMTPLDVAKFNEDEICIRFLS